MYVSDLYRMTLILELAFFHILRYFSCAKLMIWCLVFCLCAFITKMLDMCYTC